MSRKWDIVFIVGCDRTGTHLAAKMCEGPDTAVLTEGEPVFERAVAMARNPAVQRLLWDDMIAYYKVQIDGHRPKLFVDKSHPLIWFVEDLIAEFPGAGFILVNRNPHDTVNSMMNHEGVQLDMLWARCYPTPNRFVGSDGEDWFHESLAYRMAKKWLSHDKRIRELLDTMPERCFPMSYESMRYSNVWLSKKLRRFLGCDTTLATLSPPREMSLTHEQREDIDWAIRGELIDDTES